MRQGYEEQSKNNADFSVAVRRHSDFFALVLEEYRMVSNLEGSGRTSEDEGAQLRRMLGVPFREQTAWSLYLLCDGDG